MSEYANVKISRPYMEARDEDAEPESGGKKEDCR